MSGYVMMSPHGTGRAWPTSRGLNGLEMSIARTPCPSHPTNTMLGNTVGLWACIIGRIKAPGGFGWAMQFSTRLSDWAIAPTITGVISDSTLMIRIPRSGHGPNGHSSVITTHAGRFLVLPFVFDGRLGT